MQALIADALRKHPLFANCTRIELARLLAGTTRHEFPPDTEIFHAGADADHYYWILSGTIELSTVHNTWRVGADEGFGAEAFAEDCRYLLTARTITPLIALRIAHTTAQKFAAAHPNAKPDILVGLAARLGNTSIPESRLSPSGRRAEMPTKQRIGWVATLALPPGAYLIAAHSGLPQYSAIYLGLLTMTAVMWLFAVVDEFIPPLIAVVAMLFINLAPAEIALGGFYSGAFLLLLGVYALSAVLLSSGLVYRFMLWLLLRCPDKPFWHRGALTFVGMLLSAVMPSDNARLALLLPLYREMDQNIGAPSQSRDASALMIAAFVGATLFSPMLLTSKTAHLAAYAMMPIQVRLQFQGSYWLAAAAVAMVGLIASHILAMRFLYPASSSQPLPRDRIAGQLAQLGRLDSGEWLALCAFVVFVAGAALPQLYRSQTGWLAGFIMVSLLALGLFDKKAFLRNIDWPMIFFVLSMDGLTRALHYLRLDDTLVSAIGDKLDWIHGDLGWFILLTLVTTVSVRLVLPVTAGMLLAMTVLLPIGVSQGIHPWLVLFLTSLFSDIWFFPHQMSAYTQAQGSGLRARCDESIVIRHIWWLNPLRVLLAYASIPYWNWLGLN